MRGAEEVHEDENTATELPVDQVSLTVLSTPFTITAVFTLVTRGIQVSAEIVSFLT